MTQFANTLGMLILKFNNFVVDINGKVQSLVRVVVSNLKSV